MKRQGGEARLVESSRVAVMCAVAALGLAFCHPTDRPPIPPPKPTDPTSLALRSPAYVIDASIVSDGGGGEDAGFEFDTGASPVRARASP